MRAAVSQEDVDMEAAAEYFFFAERFHWDEKKVNRQRVAYLRRLRDVAAIYDEIRAEKAKPK